MVLIPFTIDPWAQFGIWPVVTGISHHHPPPPPKTLAHHAHLTPNITDPMPTSCTNVPPNCKSPLGILTSADIRQHNGRSLVTHTAPTQSLHTLQLIGLSISKAYSSLLCNATNMFQLHPTAPAFDLYSFLTLEDTYPVSM